jgi:phosphate transport system substrate-binding protein
MDVKNMKLGGAVLVLTGLIICAALLTGCTDEGDDEKTEIVVVGRDSASGTRASFEELVDIEAPVATMQQENSNGAVHDTVATTKGAIGYVGLGYLDAEVKAVKIGNVAPSTATVLDGSYPIARSLYMITDGQPTGLAEDFIKFVLSAAGQQIVEDEGFIPLATPGPDATGMDGTLTIAGSTTVLPIAQACADAYHTEYGADITVSGGGSSVGVASATDGTADIGMASRDLKSSEQTEHPNLVTHTVAKDGISVIVHKDNKIESLTVEEVQKIYTGEITVWEDVWD